MKKLVVAAGIVAGLAFGAAAFAQTEPTIPVIVKDVTSPYWRAVLAGARKAGKDFGVNVVGLGPQSEADTNGQIGILAKAVASNPAAIVIAPAEYAALGKPIDEAAKKVKIIAKELRRGKCTEDELLLESQEVERPATLRRIKRTERLPTFCRHEPGLERAGRSGVPAASLGLSDCLVCELPGRA